MLFSCLLFLEQHERDDDFSPYIVLCTYYQNKLNY